jgi:hypothetical protein
MRLYRVAWVDPGWARRSPEDPFHPLFVPLDRQGGGRFDNPHLYAALYSSTTPQGAVGESFGNSAVWIEAEITRPKDGHPRCLVEFEIPDDTVLFDLDDPPVLVELAIRPSDVVRRNRDRTREIAQVVWRQMPASGVRGFTWWSYWRPEWTVVVLWSANLDAPWFPFASIVDVTPLAIDHPAVQVAADVLPRERG